jgi:hypothetical protein
MPQGGHMVRSEDSEDGECLRVFLAEGNGSDRFWLEMVFRTSQLSYSIEVVTEPVEAAQCLEERGSEMDLIFDAFGVAHQLPGWEHPAYFVFTNTVGENDPSNYVEKPFTRQKLIDCLYAAELHAWAGRLSGQEAAA